MPLELTEYSYPTPKYGQLPQHPPGVFHATQSIAIGASSAPSAAFNTRTDFIVITKVDADCRIVFGDAPVAVAGAGNGRFLKAGVEYSFDVEGGQKVAVINA